MRQEIGTAERRLKVFVSYATEDRGIANEIVEKLTTDGFDPWYDQHILPGQQWEAEIESNQSNADVVLMILSKSSVNKRGLVQREAQSAIKKLDDLLPSDIYIIPIRIDDCPPPDRIRNRIQFVDWNREDAWLRISTSLKSAARARGLPVGSESRLGDFAVREIELRETENGENAYEITIEYPEFSSEKYASVAQQLTTFFSAKAAANLIENRSIIWRTFFDKSLAGWETSSSRHQHISVQMASSKFFSAVDVINYYAVGAAHGNMHFDTFNFHIVENKLIPFSLPQILDYSYEALTEISRSCIEKLRQEYWNRTGEEADESVINEWFIPGAGPDWKNFECFTLSADGITVYFPPYQVYAYVLGPWTVEIPFYELRLIAAIKVFSEIILPQSET